MHRNRKTSPELQFRVSDMGRSNERLAERDHGDDQLGQVLRQVLTRGRSITQRAHQRDVPAIALSRDMQLQGRRQHVMLKDRWISRCDVHDAALSAGSLQIGLPMLLNQ